MEAAVTNFYAYLLAERRVSFNTYSAYKVDIDQLCSFLTTKKIRLRDATIDDLKDFLQHLKKQSINPRSASRKISAIRTMFEYLHHRQGWANIAADLTFPKVAKTLPRYLAEGEIERLMDVAAEDETPAGIRNRVMLALLYVSGMRISELVNMKRSDIQFESGFITVLGKGGKERMIPIVQGVMDVVKQYIKVVHHAFVTKKDGTRQTDYLFPIFYGGVIKPISRQAFWVILRDLCKKAGIERAISPHQLRHSLATHMLKGGAHLRSLQMMLGHENLSTVQIYTHVEKSHLRMVYDKKHLRS